MKMRERGGQYTYRYTDYNRKECDSSQKFPITQHILLSILVVVVVQLPEYHCFADNIHPGIQQQATVDIRNHMSKNHMSENHMSKNHMSKKPHEF